MSWIQMIYAQRVMLQKSSGTICIRELKDDGINQNNLADRDSNKMFDIHYLNTIFREGCYYLDRSLMSHLEWDFSDHQARKHLLQ